VIYYDQVGRLRAIGAEIQDPDINITAADEGWIKVSWRVFNLGFVSTHSDATIGSSCSSDLRGLSARASIVLFPQR
jgi:hypothetical protein